MRRILGRRFFDRQTLRVAQELPGKYLVRQAGGKKIGRMITEVEAYAGFLDRASHASRGKTPRNQVMFGSAGRWYVYLVYGMHWMLNIVTEQRGYPAAILIRGVEGILGPARAAKAFKIDSRMNGRPASRRTGVWVEDRGIKIPRRRVKRGTRIGVDYAGPWKRKLWRFYLDRV